jgi:curved DNA-binding protein
MDFKDYYKTLGLAKTASEKEIKSSFKQLAKQLHPDTQGGSEAKFKEINEAYEVLKDPSKKGRYDYLYKTVQEENNFKTRDFKQSKMYSDTESFKDFYNRAKEEQKKEAPQPQGSRVNDKTDTKNFSDFFEMFFGKHRERANGESSPNTTTQEQKPKQPKRGEDFEMETELSFEDAYHGCVRKIEISAAQGQVRRLEVSIPPGVRTGTKIKVANEGKPGSSGGISGDLFLRVKLKAHDTFWLENDDVHSEIKLEPYEAVLGTAKKISTINDIVELIIPPNTHNGRILRLRSKGMKNSSGVVVGDHYVHIIIDIPKKISDEELKSYKYLKELSERKF